MATTNNRIEIYPKNTKSIYCVVTGLSMTGYTPYLTVKRKTTDAETALQLTGWVSDSSTLIFDISSSDSSIAVGDYVYSIEVELDSSIYTVVRDKFTVIDGVKY